MIVILTIQISALSYGLIKIEQERVWAIVHTDGVFMLVTKKEILPEQLTQDYKLPKFNNIYYAMVLDSELVLNAQESDKVIYYNPKRYHPLTKKIISSVNIIYAKLPIEIRKKYDSSHYFKFLAGKKTRCCGCTERKSRNY
jgi:predicted component of type VI protein secretion system